MSEGWCFVAKQALFLLLACHALSMVSSVQIQGKHCSITYQSKTQKGFCVPDSKCQWQNLIDLRSQSSNCDGAHICCPININEPAVTFSTATFAECDTGRGYCVGSNLCTVLTFRLRSNRCPTYEEVCCPKNYVKVPDTTTVPTTTSELHYHKGKVANVTIPSPQSATERTPVVTEASTKNSTESSHTTVSPNKHGTTNDDSNDHGSNIKQNTGHTTESPLSAAINVTGAESAKQNVTVPVGNNITTTPPTLIPLSSNQSNTKDDSNGNESIIKLKPRATTKSPFSTAINANDAQSARDNITVPAGSRITTARSPITTSPTISPVRKPSTTDGASVPTLASKFTAENFAYQECGHRNRHGVLETTQEKRNRAEYGEYPWTVALFQVNQATNEMRYCCNGALVSEVAVVTTAHCITKCGGSSANLIVRLGEWIMNSTAEPILHEEIGVLKVIKHPQFHTSSLINNIAVLQLHAQVEFKPTIQPICLPLPDYQLRSRENLIATGWGSTVEQTLAGERAMSDVLKRIDLHNDDFEICNEELGKIRKPYAFQLDPSFVCCGTENEERPCEGDAGAPVAVESKQTTDLFYLHGLVSWGYGCGQDRNKRTILTNVANFRDWLDDVLTEM